MVHLHTRTALTNGLTGTVPRAPNSLGPKNVSSKPGKHSGPHSDLVSRI